MSELYKSSQKRLECQLGVSRNSKVLASFVAYCQANPDLRFWQALCSWAHVGRICAIRDTYEKPHIRDTFNWEGRDA